MGNIEIVIKIPEEDFERCKKRFQMRIDIMADVIANGTPLPKGHRFIDADEILNHAFIREGEDGDIFVQKYYCIRKEIVDNALVLFDTLEADKHRGSKDMKKLSWLGKNCKDCGNEKCKKLGTLPKGYDCALCQPEVKNYSIKTVTNAKDAENYPISEDISKAFEEFSKTMSIQRQAESEEEE